MEKFRLWSELKWYSVGLAHPLGAVAHSWIKFNSFFFFTFLFVFMSKKILALGKRPGARTEHVESKHGAVLKGGIWNRCKNMFTKRSKCSLSIWPHDTPRGLGVRGHVPQQEPTCPCLEDHLDKTGDSFGLRTDWQPLHVSFLHSASNCVR